MKPIRISWPLWAAGLVLTILLISFSGVNNDNVDGFVPSVGYGLKHGDVLLILGTLLTLFLLGWVLLAIITGAFSKSSNDPGDVNRRLFAVLPFYLLPNHLLLVVALAVLVCLLLKLVVRRKWVR